MDTFFLPITKVVWVNVSLTIVPNALTPRTRTAKFVILDFMSIPVLGNVPSVASAIVKFVTQGFVSIVWLGTNFRLMEASVFLMFVKGIWLSMDSRVPVPLEHISPTIPASPVYKIVNGVMPADAWNVSLDISSKTDNV